MHRLRSIVLALIAPLILVTPALAQEGENMSAAKAFLWSDDLLGLAIIWILVAMSMICIALIMSFMMKFSRGKIIPDDVASQIEQMLNEKRYREAIEFAQSDSSYLASLISAGLGEASNGYPAMERAIEEEADNGISRMLRPLEFLNVMGNVSPMLGLFGTVYGMILAFQQLVAAGGRPDPAQLAAGISTALVTTFWGLVVAIPALAGFALIRNRVDVYTSEGILIAEDLIAPFKPGGNKKSGSRRAAQQKAAE